MKKFRRKVLDMLMSNNSGSSLRQQLLDGAPFLAELTHTAVPQRAATGTTATFTRATTKTVENNDGYLVTLLAGEIGFPGARRVRNLLSATEDFSDAAWTKINGGAGSAPTVTSGFTAPDGTATAWRLQANAGGLTGADYSVLRQTISTAIPNNLHSIYIKSNTGSSQVVYFGSAETDDNITATTSWQRLSLLNTDSSALFDIGSYRPGGFGSSEQSIDVLIWHPQFEDVTAQTTQTAGEYVSVGVESAPYYHGSFVDGIKCFPTDLAGNALPTSYTYDAVSLNGVAGTYVSTPDSVAASITGDIDIRWYGLLDDWTPAAGGYLISKRNNAVGLDESYGFFVNSPAVHELGFAHNNGGTQTIVLSTAAPTVSNGQAIWVRVTWKQSTGFVNFYQSSDGVVWVQVGAADVVGPTTAINEGPRSIGVCGNPDGSQTAAGKCYRAQIYNGIDGTLAVDFDASRYAGGTTLTGSTGETWTLQGNAVIHPTNSPMLGYQAEGARTNLCLQSQTLQTATWAVSAGANPISVNSSVAPDGTTTADLLYEKSDAVVKYVAQSITITTAAHTWSVYAKENGRRFLAIDAYDGSQHLSYFDLVNGTTGTNAAGNTSSIESVGDGWYRCSVTRTAAGTGGYIQLYLAEVDNSISYTGDGSSGIYLWGAQVELGAFASSYIATTTAAVTRNADVLTYSSAGNIDGTVGWAYCETNLGFIDAATNNWMITRDNDKGLLYSNGTDGQIVVFDGVQGAVKSGLSTLVGTYTNCASTWGGGSQSVTANGAAPATAAFDGDMSPTTTIDIGANSTGNLWGTIRNVRIGQRQLSASELGAITS